ncbi:hypothetical protein FZEAL_1563 [Fusarium zealandicum]|uniref:LPXTG-domain-containing protein n=1 Tax=Fusarium zealandicum TaxID=1053134 RepID=A0A8H4XNN5_9HYPO|nr:hypothetical protein FZEAL_1563 [Fusarium zealandicum]
MPFLVFLFVLFSSWALALQVTPNSPCAQFCLDSSDSDHSDPESSNTRGKDIVCNDDDFKSKPEGQRFQRCLACLQDSTFKRGSENDQDWFLYNLRYSFDYCIFGYPNATDINSSPCVTSEACGPLEAALKGGIIEPDDRKQYDYCDATGKVMLGDAYAKCQSCVKADRTHTIVSNFLVALEAGCQQQPMPGTVVGLNATVFSETSIGIIDPSASLAPEDATALPNTSIAGIAVGGVVLALIIAACIYIQCRKRRNRAARNRRSSLSFRCQAHLTPRSPYFRNLPNDYLTPPHMEKENAQSEPSLWNPRNAMSSLRGGHKLSPIETAVLQPPPAHTNLQRSPEDDTSPMSSISSRSNAPLLPNNGAITPILISPLFSPGVSVASPRSGTLPLREHHNSNNPWQQKGVGETGKGFLKKKGSVNAQSPVETQNIQVKFDPPPKKAK